MWLVVLFTIAPHRLLTYLAFFVPLFILVTTGVGGLLLTFRLALPAEEDAALAVALRRGGLLATVVVISLALAAANKESLLGFILTLVIAAAMESACSIRSTPESGRAASLHKP